MIKLVVISALVASSIAALPPFRQFPNRPPVLPSPLPSYSPLPTAYPQQSGRFIPILRQAYDSAPDGSSYDYSYETGNGISAQESGRLVGSGPEVAIGATGSFQYTSPEGVPVQISYTADQGGFQPTGNVLPTPPPIPEAILRSLAYIAAHPQQQSAVLPLGRQTYYKR